MQHLDYRVCSLDSLRRVVKSHNATHIVSLVDPGMPLPRTPGRTRGRHLGMHVHDVDMVDPGHLKGNPHPDHVNTLVDFALALPAQARPVFHCVAGKRRSAAAALLCDLALQLKAGAKPDHDLIVSCWDNLKQIRPVANPNRAILQLADAKLGFNGALDSYRPARQLILD